MCRIERALTLIESGIGLRKERVGESERAQNEPMIRETNKWRKLRDFYERE